MLFSSRKMDAQVLNICQGDTLRLSTTVLNLPDANSVEWFKNNVLISTDTSFKIFEAGTYTLRCTGTTGCVGDFSQPLTVIVDMLTANMDSISTQPNTPVNIRVLVNDQQACYPIDTPTMTIAQQGAHGTVITLPDGTFTYQPNTGFVGIDTFYYYISDVNGNPSNIAMVIVNITTDAPNEPLAVILVSFEAVKVDNQAHLTWVTSSTNSASHFEVERSADGKTFEFKGKVAAPAQSHENTSYSYWDTKPLSGKNYYRLKLVSLNGDADYSEIRSVNFGANTNVNIYPNPATSYIIVDLGQQSTELNAIQIFDAAGNEVLETKISGSSNTIELNSLSSGIYFIRLVDKDNKLKDTSYKFTKVK